MNGQEGGSSKRFVERGFKLTADGFIGGNGKVVGHGGIIEL